MQSELERHAQWIIETETLKTVADRAVAYLYIVAKSEARGVSVDEVRCFFEDAGLGKHGSERLRKYLKGSPYARKTGKDIWRFSADKFSLFETAHRAYTPKKLVAHSSRDIPDLYVSGERIAALEGITSSSYDFVRLARMLSEANSAWCNKNYICVILLVRAILDHVPPVFSCKNFSEVANNYASGSSSFKQAMGHLDNSSRKIADSYLHVQIRKKESLPNDKQANFISDLDFLLAEICRVCN